MTNSWREFISIEREKDYFKKLIEFVHKDSLEHTIYPPREDIFNAFKYCPLEKTRLVILGMDPYINPGQAHGLAFSVPEGIDKPPSLQNIFKELQSNLGIVIPESGCLIPWAKQGILLINSIMTVRAGQSNSHKDSGWMTFSDNVISFLNERGSPCVFLLWGSHAKSKAPLITHQRHCVLMSAHPSPLSAYKGFFGSQPFSKANRFLDESNLPPIDWSLT